MKLVDRLAAQGYRYSDKHCAQCGKFWQVPDLSDLFPPCLGRIRTRSLDRDNAPSKPATPEEVASSYERAMQEQAVPFHEDRAISMDCILTEHHLRLILKPVFVGMYISDRPPREPFPSPALVEDSCRGHLEGSMGKRLKARVRGGPWKPDNLVPAIVAFFLRTHGGMDGRKEINRLLNEHVLRDTGCSDRQGHRVSPLW